MRKRNSPTAIMAPRDRLPKYAKDLPLKPKFQLTPADNCAMRHSDFMPGADPVALAIIECFSTLFWRMHSREGSDGKRYRTNTVTVGEAAMEQAFCDLLCWLQADERERARILKNWIGRNYIKDWPLPLTSPTDPGGQQYHERFPLRMLLSDANCIALGRAEFASWNKCGHA